MGWVKRSFFICCRFHDRIVDLEHRLATRLTDVSTVRAAQSGQERHPGFAACRGVRAPAAVPIVPSAYAPRLPVTRQAFYDGCESVLRRKAARAPAVTLPYLGDRFDVGVTASLVYLDPQSSVVVLEGAMTAASPQAAVGRCCDAV